MSPASYADMKVHMDNKHPKEPFGLPEQEAMKKKFADMKAEAQDKARAKSGQMNKKDSKGGKEKKSTGSKKGAGNTDELPAELLAAMSMGATKKKKK